MGCDIHLYVEVKKNGKWECAQAVREIEDGLFDVPSADRYHNRDYLLFGLLAGVRDTTLQSFVPKGFPEDASLEIQKIYDRWEGDAHTPSWLTLEELQRIRWDAPIPKKFIPGEKQQRFLERFQEFYWKVVSGLRSYDYRAKPDELRIVFWFDN